MSQHRKVKVGSDPKFQVKEESRKAQDPSPKLKTQSEDKLKATFTPGPARETVAILVSPKKPKFKNLLHRKNIIVKGSLMVKAKEQS